MLLTSIAIAIVSAFSLWWPRRTSFVIRWSGGKVMSHSDFARQRELRKKMGKPGSQWTLQDQLDLAQRLSWTRQDEEITWIDLSASTWTTSSLRCLKRMPKSIYVSFHNRQLGTGLDALSFHTELVWAAVTDPKGTRLAELSRLPQVEDLTLYQVKAEDVDLRPLRQMAELKHLTIDGCHDLSYLLRQFDGFDQLNTLDFERCQGFSSDDLKELKSLRLLNAITFTECSPIKELGLVALSQIKSLTTVVFNQCPGPINDQGIEALANLTSLKELNVVGTRISPDQQESLKRRLPKCTIRIR